MTAPPRLLPAPGAGAPDGDGTALATYHRLLERRQRLLDRLDEARDELARLDGALTGLAPLVAADAPQLAGPRGMIVAFLATLAPGAEFTTGDVLAFGRTFPWLSSAKDRRATLQARLSRMPGLVGGTKVRGTYRKLGPPG